MTLSSYLKASIAVLEDSLTAAPLHHAMTSAATLCAQALFEGLPLLVCGNGGSASDAQHIAGELVGRFTRERQALNVICLSDNAAVLTAVGNDYGFKDVFRRQVEAYGKPGGILMGLSTSGNSTNVIEAFHQAKMQGLTTIALTGQSGGQLKQLADISIAAPSAHTPLIQQAHLCYYHCLCDQIESIIVEQTEASKQQII